MPEEVLDNTLTDAISKAVEVHKDELAAETSTAKEEVKEEAKEEVKEEETKKEEPDPDLEQGRILIKALRDPQQAQAIIDYLATQAGYTKQNIQTKQDVKEAKKDINEILERNLGEEYKFLAPKLGPAIKESLEALMAENNETGDLRARLEKQELKEIQQETAATHTALAKEWFDSELMPDNVIKLMTETMDEFPPTDPKMSADRYYRKIFSMAVGELGLQKHAGAKSDRIAKNKEDSAVRSLSSQNRGVTPSTSGNPRKLSLKDAVAQAIEQVNQSSKK